MNDTTTLPMSKLSALRWLVHHSPVTVASYTELAAVFGWERAKTWKVVQEWRRKGYLETNTAPDTGSLTVTIIPNVLPLGVSDDDSDPESDTVREGAASLPSVVDERSPPVVPPQSTKGAPWKRERPEATETVYATYVDPPRDAAPGFDAADAFRRGSAWERLLLIIAVGLSGTAAYISVNGMLTLYPAGGAVILVLGGLMESLKFVGFGVVSAGWRAYSWMSRWIFATLLLIAATVNACGVYGWLISQNAAPAAARSAAFTRQDADAGAKLEVASGRLADIDRRINLIDAAAEGAAKKGMSKSAIAAIEAQKRQRATLVTERQQVAQEVAQLKAGRSGLAARHGEDEAAALPVKYAAALFEDVGLLAAGTDPQKLFRWISFFILLCGDPAALAALFMVNSRARRGGAA
jgi:hypothetical protein